VDTDQSENVISETASAGTVVGITAEATDADAGDVVSYSLNDNRFSIDANGVITVASGASFDASTEGAVSLEVTATSTDGSTSSTAFALTVRPENGGATTPPTGGGGSGGSGTGVSLSVDTDSSDNTIFENASAGTVVGITAEATDADAGDVVSYSLSDNRFSIDGNGVITVASGASFDASTESAIGLEVTATSSDGSTSTTSFAVAVNEPAPVTNSGISIVDRDQSQDRITDRAGAGTLVGITAQALGVDVSDASIVAVDDPRFEIVDGLLRLRADVSLDFETEPTVTLNLTATDQAGTGQTIVRTFTIDVNDLIDVINGTPFADVLIGAQSVDHVYGGQGNDVLNGAAGNDELYGEEGDDTLTGGEGDDLVNGGLGNDEMIAGAGADTVDGGEGVDGITYVAAGAGVTIDLVAGTGQGDIAEGDTLISVENVTGSAFDDVLDGDAEANELTGLDGNDAITGGAGADKLVGGAGNDTLIGGDGNDDLYGGDGDDTLDAGAGDDMLVGGAGSDILIGGLDRDVYEINRLSGSDTVVNLDPSGAGDNIRYTDDVSYDELWFEQSGDDLLVSIVGTDVVTTIQDWFVAPPIGQPENLFKVDLFLAGERVTTDIDIPTILSLMAPYAKPADLAGMQPILADIGTELSDAWGLNQGPSLDPISDQSTTEDTPFSFNIKATDSETAAANLTIRILSSDQSVIADGEVVVGEPDGDGNRLVTIAPVANAHGNVTLTVEVEDGNQTITTQSLAVSVASAVDTPVLSVSDAQGYEAVAIPLIIEQSLFDQDGSEVLENIQILGVPAAASLSAGSDQGGGVWSLTNAQLDGLTITPPAGSGDDIVLTVRATARELDTGALATAEATLTVVVNGAPTDIELGASVEENSVAGTLVGTAAVVDPDGTDTYTYELLDNAGGRFNIDATTGDVTVAAGASLDFETSTSHSVQVRATDQNGVFIDKTATIQVADVNEVPGFTGPSSFSVSEAAGNGTIVGTVTAEDVDAGTNGDLTYSLTGDAGGRFAIDASTGAISVANAGAINFETNTSHKLTVQAIDGGGLSGEQDVTISVSDVNEAPSVANNNFSVSEHVPVNTIVGRLNATDPDSGENGALSYQITSGNVGNAFYIDSQGQIRTNAAINFESISSYSLGIAVRDKNGGVGHLTDTATVNVAIMDVNEAPTISMQQIGNWTTFAEAYPGQGYSSGILLDNSTPYANTGAIVGGGSGAGTFRALRFTASDADTGLNGSIVFHTDHPNLYFDGQGYLRTNSTTPWPNVVLNGGHGGSPAVVTVFARDRNGGVGYLESSVSFQIGSVWGYRRYPISLDLDGDGTELVSVHASSVKFSFDEGETLSRTGWIAADDAWLALDRNGDGIIGDASEISFVQDLPGAKTDLEGLAAFDTDGDNMLDADDERFDEFLVWQDRNQNGVSEADELVGLTEQGIASIDLTRTPTGATTDFMTDNVIVNTSTYTKLDGSTAEVGDVVIVYEPTAQAAGFDDPLLTIDDASQNTATFGDGADATAMDLDSVREELKLANAIAAFDTPGAAEAGGATHTEERDNAYLAQPSIV